MSNEISSESKKLAMEVVSGKDLTIILLLLETEHLKGHVEELEKHEAWFKENWNGEDDDDDDDGDSEDKVPGIPGPFLTALSS